MPFPFSPEEVANRLAIEDLYARYVFACDDQQYDVLDQVFLPDAVVDWGHAKGDREFVKNLIKHNNEISSHLFHFCGNFRIDFAPDLQSARVKFKMLFPMGRQGAGGETEMFQVHGSYSDLVVKTAEGWRVKERKWNHGWVVGGLQLIDGEQALMQKPQE